MSLLGLKGLIYRFQSQSFAFIEKAPIESRLAFFFKSVDVCPGLLAIRLSLISRGLRCIFFITSSKLRNMLRDILFQKDLSPFFNRLVNHAAL